MLIGTNTSVDLTGFHMNIPSNANSVQNYGNFKNLEMKLSLPVFSRYVEELPQTTFS